MAKITYTITHEIKKKQQKKQIHRAKDEEAAAATAKNSKRIKKTIAAKNRNVIDNTERIA